MSIQQYDKTDKEKMKKNRVSVSFKEACLYWLKLGFISFGGPAGQISIMHQDLVEKRGWISEKRFLHALNFTMVLPGPEAQQLATYIGWLLHGVKGGLIAGILFLLPSFFLLISLTWVYLEFGDLPLIQGILYGIKPAVTAIVLFAAYRIGIKTLTNSILIGISIAAFIAIFFLKLPFPLIILIAGLIGYIGVKFYPDLFINKKDSKQENASDQDSIINDDFIGAKHTVFSWKKIIRFILYGAFLWILLMAVLSSVLGWDHTLTKMSWFFTKAALLTFGGAYAVLPYVYQGGVEDYAWLSASQMIDGLALGESTPGPLIMIVTYIGFVGGWTKELFGPEMQALAGVVAASLVTFFTFLPSFLFIFIGGPVVEASRGIDKFTGPLTGITAAVVGVIVNLAVFFAYHVYWPEGISSPEEILKSSFDWVAALIGLCAIVLLVKYKLDIIKVLLISAIIGVCV